MTIIQDKPKRQNRTITLYLGQTLAEYEMTYLTKEGDLEKNNLPRLWVNSNIPFRQSV